MEPKSWDHLLTQLSIESHDHEDPQEGQVLTDDADAEEDSIFITDEVTDH